MNIKNPKKLLSVSEVSEYLCIPLKSVYYLTEIGKIRGIKVGRQWRYHLSNIEFYYQNGTNRKAAISNITNPAGDIRDITERRAFPRINCNIRCSYEVVIPLLKEFSSTSSIRNISGNGIFLYALQDSLKTISVGDPVNLRFPLNIESGENGNLDISGRVVRKTGEGIGIKFKDVSKSYQDLIIKYVG